MAFTVTYNGNGSDGGNVPVDAPPTTRGTPSRCHRPAA